mgnify:CR=1 FL=1
MTDTNEAGGSQSQLVRAHAYLDFLVDQERQQARCQDPLVMTDDNGGGAGADTDATNDTSTENGADDVPVGERCRKQKFSYSFHQDHLGVHLATSD